MAAVVPLGKVVSGQAWVQPLLAVQVILPPFSEVSRYRVCPLPLTSTVPTPDTFLVLTVTAEDDVAPAAPADALLAAELGLALELDPEADVPAEAPQAATATAAPKITPPPSSRRAVEPEWGRTVLLTRETSF